MSPQRSGRGRLALVALGFTFLLVPFLPLVGSAYAATSVTSFPPGRSGIVSGGGTPPPAAVRLVGTSLVLMSRTVPGPTTQAGTQSPGTVGLAGTTARLPPCNLPPCIDNYRGAGAAKLVAGHWAEEVQLSVVQPSTRHGGVASGFALEVAIRFPLGWTFEWGYFSTGTTRAATNQTVQLHFWIDLLTTVRPTPLSVIVLVSQCSSAGSCP